MYCFTANYAMVKELFTSGQLAMVVVMETVAHIMVSLYHCCGWSQV